MAKQTVDIGAVANDGTGDPIRTAMQKINGNFTEVYNSLGGDIVTNLVNADEEIELLGTANKISFLYALESEVLALDPATHHGNIAHAHDTGAMYYAHGQWNRLLSDNSAGNINSYVDPLAPFVYDNTITNTEAADYVLSTNADGTYTWVTNAGGGGASNLPDLGDVTISSPTSGQVLKYNGSAWINDTDATGGGGANIAVSDEGSSLTTGVTSFNFVGSGVTASTSGDDVTVTISGGGGGGDFATLTEVNTADLDVDDIALQAVSNLVVTGPDSTRYLIDQYPGDNPTVYVDRGQTIAFNLDGVTASHPFRILDIGGGSQYNTGLIHVAQDGTTTTGASAQDKTSGTLYWKVPGNAPAGTYEYVCTVHASMNGDIVVADPAAGGGGGGSATRNSEAETTASIADGSSDNVEYATIGKSYALYTIQSDGAAWVRIYSDTAARTADAGRSQGVDPAEGSGVIAEAVFTGAGTVKVTPAVMGWLDNSETVVPVAIQNNTGSTGTVTVTLTALTLET
jgi:plastocyanin